MKSMFTTLSFTGLTSCALVVFCLSGKEMTVQGDTSPSLVSTEVFSTSNLGAPVENFFEQTSGIKLWKTDQGPNRRLNAHQRMASVGMLPLEFGMAVVTCYSGLGGPTTTAPPANDPNGFVLAIMDIRDPEGTGAPAAPTNWATPSATVFHDPSWIAGNMGEVFGIALTDDVTAPDIFVSAFGLVPGFSAAITGGVDIVPGAGGNGGDIYRIDGTTGAISRLVSLPNTIFTYTALNGPTGNELYAGLGNISYDGERDVLYAANLDDGLIYAVNATNGAVISTFDHGTQGLPAGSQIPDNSNDVYTDYSRMVFGLQYNARDGRLYYGVGSNGQVYSLAINPDGTFDPASSRLDLTSPQAQPVQDISFNAAANRILISQFTFDEFSTNDFALTVTSTNTSAMSGMQNLPIRAAHEAAVHQFALNCDSWVFNNTFSVGTFDQPGSAMNSNSSGGSDYGFNNYDDDPAYDEDAVVMMGDALQFQFGNPGTGIYGLQISDIDGNEPGFPANSYFIDLDGVTANPASTGSQVDYDKFLLGDVEVFGAPAPVFCDLAAGDVLSCDVANGTFTFTVQPTLTGGSSFCLQGSAGTGSGAATGNTYGSLLTFGPFQIADGGVTLTITDETDNTCSETISIAPTDCTNQPCAITAISTSPGTCDPATNTYSATVTVTFENDLGGILRVSIDGQDATVNNPVSPQDFVVSGLTSDGLLKDVTATFDDDPACTLTDVDNYTAPTACPVDCFLTFSNIQATDCNNGTFTGTFGLDYTGAPTTGVIEYSTNDDGNYQSAGVVPTGTATGQSVVIPGLDCNTRSIQMRFSEDTDCAIYIAYSFGPIDPAGYVYCIEDGTILEGGEVTVGLPPGGNFQFLNAANGDPLDGRNGRYAFVAVGTGGNPPVAGEYTISYTPPNGEPLVANPTPFGNGDDILDPTQTVDGGTGDNDQTDVNMNLLIGSDINGAGTMLQDFTLAANPYFTRFNLTPGDPFIDLNNLPVQCLPDCERMEILETFASCTDNGDGTYTFEVSFQVFWTYDNATNETINIMVDGVMEEAYVPTTNGGSESFGPYTFTAPRFNLPISAAFSEKTGCADNVQVDLIACTPNCDDRAGNANIVGGTAFMDADNNGMNDDEAGQPNVLVRVYDCAEMLVCEVYTDENGDWSCDNAMMGDTFRVEYTTPITTYLSESFAGPDNGTSTQFIIGGTCGADYGVFDPGEFCDQNPTMMLPCYIVGDPNFPSTPDEAFVSLDYMASGRAGDAGYQPPQVLLTKDQIGTVWGVDYNREEEKIYTSALFRRQYGLREGLATNPLGAIYVFNEDGSDFGLWAEVNDPGVAPTNASRGLGDPDDPVYDIAAYELPGTVGIGDLDLSADNTELYAVNLNTKSLIRIPINDDGTPGAEESYPIPLDACGNPADARPWALEVYQGKVYAGVTCSAQSTGDRSDLSMSIYVFDPATATFSTSPILSLPLDYPRGPVYTFPTFCPADWNPWSDDLADVNSCGTALYYPSPILTDIEFDVDGSIIVALMDRYPLQQDFGNYVPDQSNTSTFVNYGAGDILRICRTAAGGFEYCMPVNPNDDGPNGGEFYFADSAQIFLGFEDNHGETVQGGVAILPGSGEVVAAVYDPFDADEIGMTVFNEGGIKFFNNTTGDVNRRYQVFPNNGDNGSKGVGLGDVELICALPPIQIGNYAWLDEDADGLQDPCEPPLENVTVKLYAKSGGAATELLATTTTDATGNYYFAGRDMDDATWEAAVTNDTIHRDSLYVIAFCGDDGFDTGTNSLRIDGVLLCPSPANMGQAAASNPPDGSDDQNDSDITVQDVDGVMVPAYCTTAGELADGTNHTFDAGFKPLECNVEISDLEIICNNGDDFTFSFGVEYMNTIPTNTMIEVLLDGAPVTGSPFTATAAAGNFDVEAIAVDDPAFNVPLVVRFVGDNTCADNQLLDFIACTPTCDDQPGANFVGGNAFVDANNDGTNDNEMDQPNVLVRVYDCAEMLVCEVYTDENGDWSCDNAMAGDTFRVEYSLPLSPELDESFAGTNNGTDVQFVTGGTCAADYGVVDIDALCVVMSNTSAVIPCYAPGTADGTSANVEAIVRFTLGDEGVGTSPTPIATMQQVGAVWGSSYDALSGRLFNTAFVKRYVGLAAGTGHVYVSRPLQDEFVGSFDLQNVNGIDFGSITRNQTDDDDNELADDAFSFFLDNDAFSAIGKVGIGDSDIDETGDFLWAVNLNSRTLVRVDISDQIQLPTDGTAAPASLVMEFAVDYPACNGGAARPFGLEFYNGLGYLGVVCDASASGSPADLTGYVLAFDPANPTTFTSVLTVDFDYLREDTQINTNDGEWNAWSDDFTMMAGADGTTRVQRSGDGTLDGIQISYPQPIISDLAFSADGSLTLGIMDRFSQQIGGNQSAATVAGTTSDGSMYDRTTLFRGIAGGDVLKACNFNGQLVLEGGVGCAVTDLGPSGTLTNDGPSGMGEFYYNDFFTLATGSMSPFHLETALGSVSAIPGTEDVAVVVYDPISNAGDNVNRFSSAGIHYYSTSDGSLSTANGYDNTSGQYEVIPPDGPLGKAAGLGDFVLLCEPPPIQIGNYAWLDTDADGLQDPCEPPLAGLAVKLYRKNSDDPTAPILIATDTTDATGNYYFSSASTAAGDAMQNWIGTDADTTVNRDSLYFIAFCGESGFDTGTNSLVINGMSLCPSPANMGQAPNDDQNDSDVTVQDVAGVMIPAYCTTPGDLADGTNHTFDAGFKPLIFDLALTKKISTLETDNSFRPGDQVIFDIEVINQGDVTAFDIVVGDSIPTGMIYDASATTATGTAVLTSVGGVTIDFVNDYMLANDGSFTIDSLPRMDTVVFQVAVTIDAIGTSQAARPLINYAEIQSADNDEDPANTPPEDVDSTPNDNFGDDSGGDPDSPADDFVDGNGMGMPGDTIANTDEDDADPALVPIYDLALTKIIDPGSISPTASYAPGDAIVFNINVTNQGTDTVGTFQITDYLPCGYTFDGAAASGLNDDWTLVGNQLTFDGTTDLLPGAGIQVQLELDFFDENCGGATVVDTALINRAEISQFTNSDANGNMMVVDFDSTPDDNAGNDPGGNVDGPSDNVIDGNGEGVVGDDVATTDEDDSDPAALNVFDLAIFKVVDSTDVDNLGPYTFGDTVKYQIGVVEQGNLPATNVTISDIIPPGLSFDPTFGMNNVAQGGGTWMDNGDGTTSLTISDFSTLNTAGTPALGSGDTALVCIWLRVMVPAGPIDDASFVNYAGIDEAMFESPGTPGTFVTVTGDGDSPYGLEVGDDSGGGVGSNDDNETLDNRPGDDIDSQDPAAIEVLLGVALGDTTFIDVNMNGIQDAGDEPLPGVTVTVYDATTMMVVTTDVFGQPYSNTRMTDANGMYLFDSLPSGNYYVEFNIATAPNGDLYDFTTPNVGGNAGASDGEDSDVVPANPMDDVGNSDPTGIIPPGDTLLTLDAGVVCAIQVVVADPSTICSTQPIDLTQGASIMPARLGGFWTTTGTGTFFDAAGAELTANPITGGYDFDMAVRYQPSAADGQAGEITFTLTTNDPADLAPTSSCTPVSASVTVTILNVDCGEFFWDGND